MGRGSAANLKVRSRDLLWQAYVWPKGRLGNSVQGGALRAVETRRAKRAWDHADRVILVHTPGKVGSKAMATALERGAPQSDAIFHTHRLNTAGLAQARLERKSLAPRRTWYTADFLADAIPTNPGRTKVVVFSAVRDPIDRNLSAFFQNLERYRAGGRPLVAPRLSDASELADLFVHTFPHHEITRWIDREVVDFLGCDVYGSTFDHDKGYQVYSGRLATVGIIKYNSLEQAISGMTQDLLDRPLPSIPRSNTSASKAYGTLHREVRKKIRLPPAVLEDLYDSRYARHFFSYEEREAAMARNEARQ